MAKKKGVEFCIPRDYYEEVKLSWRKNGKIESYVQDDKFNKSLNGQIKMEGHSKS